MWDTAAPTGPRDRHAQPCIGEPRKERYSPFAVLAWRQKRGRVTKKCRKCGEEKPSPKFRSNPRCRVGLSSWCVDCHNEATRLWRKRRREAEWEESGRIGSRLQCG